MGPVPVPVGPDFMDMLAVECSGVAKKISHAVRGCMAIIAEGNSLGSGAKAPGSSGAARPLQPGASHHKARPSFLSLPIPLGGARPLIGIH